MSLIIELTPRPNVKLQCICRYKQILKNKNGKDYCSVKLQDRTGTIDGKIWNMHGGIGEFEIDDVVNVEGETILFQDVLQLSINKIERAPEGTYDLKELIPHTDKDISLLEKELFQFIDDIEHSFIKKLLEEIFYSEEVYSLFLQHSAAKSVHHAYLGGLLEHTISVTKLGAYLSDKYHGVHKDLVIAGCLLHDIGKIYEISAFPKNDYTDEGQMLGHIVMGTEIVSDFAKKIPDFPKELLMLIKHIILSHHGEYEFASPKRPKCIEAMIVHLADNTDAKLKMIEEMLQNAPEQEPYVGYHKLLNRNIRKTTL